MEHRFLFQFQTNHSTDLSNDNVQAKPRHDRRQSLATRPYRIRIPVHRTKRKISAFSLEIFDFEMLY
jgi:hypothetical protein